MDDKKVKYDALDAMWAFVRIALRAGRCAAGAGERGYCGRTTVRL